MTMRYTSSSSTATWTMTTVLQQSKNNILPLVLKLKVVQTNAMKEYWHHFFMVLTQDLKTEVLDVLKSRGAFIKTKILPAVISRSLSIFLSYIQRVESPISFKA
jgi:hypothetical protein